MDITAVAFDTWCSLTQAWLDEKKSTRIPAKVQRRSYFLVRNSYSLVVFRFQCLHILQWWWKIRQNHWRSQQRYDWKQHIVEEFLQQPATEMGNCCLTSLQALLITGRFSGAWMVVPG